MFKNAGKKLGTIIKVETIIIMVIVGIAGLFISAVLEDETGGGIFLIGFFITLGIVLSIWVGALFMIGMCDMMADVKGIRGILSHENNMVNLSKVQELRDKGLISEEEYMQKVNGKL